MSFQTVTSYCFSCECLEELILTENLLSVSNLDMLGNTNTVPFYPLCTHGFFRFETINLGWSIVYIDITGITALCSLARHIDPCLVLVQPRKTCPDITEKIVDWDVKNQIKQTNLYILRGHRL